MKYKFCIKRYYKRSIAVITDTHIGGKHALMLPKWENPEGQVFKANKLQRYIYDFWRYFLEKCNEYKVDTVIHLGDAVEGYNRKEAGFNLVLSNLDDQIDCCVDILKEIVKNRKFYIVSGTTYHEATEVKIHKTIANRLGGTFCGYIADLKVKEVGKTINIAHKGSNAMIYLSTTLDREAVFLKMAEGLNKFPKVDIFLRGHLHVFDEIHQRKIRLIQCPCWKAYEPSGIFTGIVGKRIPDIGGLILLFDSENRLQVLHYLMEYDKKFYNYLEKEI